MSKSNALNATKVKKKIFRRCITLDRCEMPTILYCNTTGGPTDGGDAQSKKAHNRLSGRLGTFIDLCKYLQDSNRQLLS